LRGTAPKPGRGEAGGPLWRWCRSSPRFSRGWTSKNGKDWGRMVIFPPSRLSPPILPRVSSVGNPVVDDGAVDGLRLCLRREAASQRFRQRDLQDLVHRLDHVYIKGIQHVFRDVCQILFVVLREDDGLDAGAVRRENLLLHAADWQDLAAQ